MKRLVDLLLMTRNWRSGMTADDRHDRMAVFRPLSPSTTRRWNNHARPRP